MTIKTMAVYKFSFFMAECLFLFHNRHIMSHVHTTIFYKSRRVIMSKKIVPFAVITLFCFIMAGCMVSKDTYLKSVKEAQNLSDDLYSLNEEYMTLQSENDALKEEISKLESEVMDLENVLKAKSDELSARVVALRNQITDLEKEKAEKNQMIEELQREILETKLDKEESLKELSDTYGSMLDKMKSEIAQGQVTITELKGKLTVNMLDAVLFDLGKAEVRSEGMAVLQKVVDVLKDVKGKVIRVEGHTDNLKIHGALAKKYPSNWELSAARAVNVAKYLQEKGIDPAILSASAFSEFKPVAGNDTQKGRAQNRRIEIVLIPEEFR